MIDILTVFSVKILNFDRNFDQKFGQNNILTEVSVKIWSKIYFDPKKISGGQFFKKNTYRIVITAIVITIL